ncbi:zinc ribbon-containing protein [Halococcus salsus]
MTFDTGEQPGTGTYRCIDCGWEIELESPDNVLPPCGNCSAAQITEYEER